MSVGNVDGFLQEKISLRAPYMTPLNILQVIHLKNLREYNEEHANYEPKDPDMLGLLSLSGDGKRPPYLAAIEDAVTITMKGIASGMQNTG